MTVEEAYDKIKRLGCIHEKFEVMVGSGEILEIAKQYGLSENDLREVCLALFSILEANRNIAIPYKASGISLFVKEKE